MNNLYNREIEKNIIAMAINYQQLQGEIFDLSPEYFYMDSNRSAFLKLQDAFLKNKPITTETSFQILSANDALEYALVENYHNYKKFVSELVELNNKRKIANFADHIDLSQTTDEILAGINTLTNNIEGVKANNMVHINSLIEKYGNEKSYKEIVTSIFKTGFVDLDNNWRIKKGNLIVIAGRPSMGKTAFSLNIAKNIAKTGSPVAFFSLEMRGQELLQRLAQGEGNKFPGWEGYKLGCKRLKDIPLYIDDISNYNLRRLKAAIKTAINKFKVEIIFIDYLTLLDPPDAQNMNLAIGKISRELKLTAMQYKMPIVLLSQLSREVEKRKDKIPMLSDLRESGSIEQDADTVMFTYIPHRYGIERDAKTGNDLTNYLAIFIEKQRHYKTGKVNIFYSRDNQYMSNWGNVNYVKSLPDVLPEVDYEDIPF